MKSTIGFSKSAFKTGSACLLTLLLCAPSILAPSFSADPNPSAETIPPASEISPEMINPNAESTPVETPAPPPRRAVSADSVESLVEKGIFPADSATRATPFNRAELAQIMVKALGHNTDLVSEFPFYRDVPKDYWAYTPIEVAREKKLIEHQEDHGFYHPERPITYADVYCAIAQAITGPLPSTEATDFLLKSFKDKESLSPEVAPAAAKMARVRFFNNRNMPEARRNLLNASDAVYPEGLAPHISYLMRLSTRQGPVRTEGEATLPILPAGLTLTLSPATAIFEARLTVGEGAYFTLVSPVDPLPKGSRLRGQVTEARTTERTYTIELTEARTPDGKFYQTKAELTLKIPPKERLAFFVPGENFETVTQLPDTGEVEALPPTPTKSGPSTDNTVPSFAPPSVKPGNTPIPSTNPATSPAPAPKAPKSKSKSAKQPTQ